MRRCVVLILFCSAILLFFLQSCVDETSQDLREPGAEGPVLITIWDMESGESTKAEAAAIDFLGKNYSEVRMQRPRLRMPVMGGEMYLATESATLEQGGTEKIVINELIHLSGEIDGKPLRGTAQSMALDQKGRSCDLHQADFIWGKQRVTVRVLRVESGKTLSGEDWREEPLAEQDAAVTGGADTTDKAVAE